MIICFPSTQLHSKEVTTVKMGVYPPDLSTYIKIYEHTSLKIFIYKQVLMPYEHIVLKYVYLNYGGDFPC